MIVPSGVILPIWVADPSENQRLPSGPAVMFQGLLAAVGMGNSVTTPARVIRPTLLP